MPALRARLGHYFLALLAPIISSMVLIVSGSSSDGISAGSLTSVAPDAATSPLASSLAATFVRSEACGAKYTAMPSGTDLSSWRWVPQWTTWNTVRATSPLPLSLLNAASEDASNSGCANSRGVDLAFSARASARALRSPSSFLYATDAPTMAVTIAPYWQTFAAVSNSAASFLCNGWSGVHRCALRWLRNLSEVHTALLKAKNTAASVTLIASADSESTRSVAEGSSMDPADDYDAADLAVAVFFARLLVAAGVAAVAALVVGWGGGLLVEWFVIRRHRRSP